MRDLGWSFNRISQDLGFSPRTAKRVCMQYEIEGTFEKKKRSKHHRVTSAEEDRAIIAVLNDHPFKTAAAIKAELGLSASVQTVLNRIKELKAKGIVKDVGANNEGNPPPKTNKPRKRPKKKVLNDKEEGHCSQKESVPFNEMNVYKDTDPFQAPNFYKDMKEASSYKVNNEAHLVFNI